MSTRSGDAEPLLRVSAAAEGTGAAECGGDVCVTCSDQAVPVRVRTLLPEGMALVDTGFGAEEVSVALVDAEEGDTVLVHAKEAIARVGEVFDDRIG
ncbi:HypC/HybG/HupF family hydrogenase formation chaperone [Streptomonospora algeriensis]|uniref:HypC/HybG/HupF family hydrogenase formation chaperone n=1 Tax=Streptomonospora algeriensis TaxID=995084 RepID=A0ABW3BBT1_9ACTN